MVCHANYPCLDPQDRGLPASLSRHVITDLLRGELGYRGLVMTDDLDMGAVFNHYALEETLHLALEAGADLAMICHRVSELDHARTFLERAPGAHLDRALAAVAAAKTRLAPPVEVFSQEAFRVLDAEVWDLRVEVMGLEAASHRAPEDGKRSPVEIY